MIELEVTIPEKISLNKIYGGVHWSKRKEWADMYHEEFLDVKGVRVGAEEYPVRITYNFQFVKQALDTLNCAMMAKMLEDGMVLAGILKDDSPDYVRESVIVSRKVRGKVDKVLVSICSL